jgi:methionyl aminopeptidase
MSARIQPISPAHWPAFRAAGRAAAATLHHVGTLLAAGISTGTIDRWVREHTAALGGQPSQLGYQGFPATVCTSINEVVCHGIPRPDCILSNGDIINVDVTSRLGGWHGDTSTTFVIGEASPEARHLVETAIRCRDAGIAAARVGARLGEVGAAVEREARRAGCSIVTAFGGHGIGRLMHQEPYVRHVGPREYGPILRVGHAFTVEPMVVLGSPDVVVDDDGWTVRTRDGGWSAQAEHTVLMTEDGPEVTTVPPR